MIEEIQTLISVKGRAQTRGASGGGMVDSPRCARPCVALIRLWRNDQIGDDVLTRLEREIELAEARHARDD